MMKSDQAMSSRVPVGGQIVQELPAGHGDARPLKGTGHVAAVEVGARMVGGGGGHEEGLRLRGQLGADAQEEAVGFRQSGRGVLVDTGGGGKEEGHRELLS